MSAPVRASRLRSPRQSRSGGRLGVSLTPSMIKMPVYSYTFPDAVSPSYLPLYLLLAFFIFGFDIPLLLKLPPCLVKFSSLLGFFGITKFNFAFTLAGGTEPRTFEMHGHIKLFLVEESQ
jgi:hypothetical protein